MPVPAKRRSSSKGRRNRSHEALKKVKLNACPNCGEAILPHTACKKCGSYKGREAVKVKAKTKK